MDIELFLLGISISFIPLLLTIWAATNYTTFFNIELMKYRHELVYGGGSALLLVLFEHYRGAHRYAILASLIFLIGAAVIAALLLMYNNQPGIYNIQQVINDKKVAQHIILMHNLSIPVFCANFMIGIALICARKFSMDGAPQIYEADRSKPTPPGGGTGEATPKQDSPSQPKTV